MKIALESILRGGCRQTGVTVRESGSDAATPDAFGCMGLFFRVRGTEVEL